MCEDYSWNFPLASNLMSFPTTVLRCSLYLKCIQRMDFVSECEYLFVSLQDFYVQIVLPLCPPSLCYFAVRPSFLDSLRWSDPVVK